MDPTRHDQAAPKPEEFAQGGQTANPPLSSRRMSFSSSFLQPEQFITELKVITGADIRPELSDSLASRRRSEDGTHRLAEADLECFYEPANSVPTLELSYEGKPAPAPAHLRTVRITGIPTLPPIATETAPPVADKNSEDSETPVLQKSSSRGASGRLHKMRETLVRSLSGGRETEGDAGIHEIEASIGGKQQSGRLLRRMLRWGASMEFLKSLGKKSKNGNPNMDCFPNVVKAENTLEPDEDGPSSPRSSASSVSTTYSEVSSKSQSYKHSHKKNLKSEVVKSKLWLLRVHQKLQGRGDPSKDSDDEGDGIYEALRQGAMFQETLETEAADSLGVLEKNSIFKLAAKHKRNSTWDAGKPRVVTPDHIFSPKQPRLPNRDAHVLLAPPKRLTGETELQSRKPSRLIVTETVNPTQAVTRLPSQGQTVLETLTLKSPCTAKSAEQSSSIRVELPTPPMSPRNGSSAQRSTFPGFSPPLPLPVRARSSPITSPKVCATSPRVPRRYAAGSPGGGGLGLGFQSSLIAGLDATSHQGLNSVEPFSLEESPNSSLASHSRSDSAVAGVRNGVNGAKIVQELPKNCTEMERNGGNAVLLPRLQLSFEQIVAGRGRSPPTDNTLMKFFFKCREIGSLNKFLALQKRRFLDSTVADSEKCFHMIMSEAGAGLSSMISTICTAWLLENTMASATSRVWHPIPVMNMCQQDMWNHRDAAWLFHVCGIDANAVLFRDEITSSNEAVISGRVKRAVIGQDILVTKIDEVASSCTIVSEKFRQEALKLLQARYMMTLLLAGILVDTNNLSSGSSRDKQQATILLVGAGSLGRNGFYNHLMNIRDEDYVTMYIKEIYGESNALTGEKPAQLAQGIEKLETKGATLQNDEKSHERPPSLATSKVSSQVSPSPVPSQKETTKLGSKLISETESKQYDDMKEPESLSRNQSPLKTRPPNSKISQALRRLRSRSSAAQ